MTKLTKADIDALVSLVESCGGDRVLVGPESVDEAWLRRALYLAAGLQADGSPKPEQVDVWCRDEPRRWLATGTWDGQTFTPDGAE